MHVRRKLLKNKTLMFLRSFCEDVILGRCLLPPLRTMEFQPGLRGANRCTFPSVLGIFVQKCSRRPRAVFNVKSGTPFYRESERGSSHAIAKSAWKPSVEVRAMELRCGGLAVDSDSSGWFQ
jgi:hypothetical protein